MNSHTKPQAITTLVSRVLYFTCMKNKITITALNPAMASATTGLKLTPPVLKSTVEANQVTSVIEISVPNTAR